MDTEIDKVSIEIGSNSDKAVNGLDKLQDSLEKLLNITTTMTSSLNSLNSTLSNLKNAGQIKINTKGLQKAREEVEKTQKAASINLSVKEAMQGTRFYQTGSEEVKRSISGFKTMKTELDAIREKAEKIKLERVEEHAKVFAIKLKAAQVNMMRLKAATEEQEKRTAKVKEVFNQLQATTSKIASKIKSAFGKIGTILAGVGKAFKKVFGGPELDRGLKKLLRYGMALFSIRGAYALISNAAKSWLSSENSAAQQLSANIDYLKYTLGSALAPVIQYIVNLLTYLLRLIQQVAYAFTGVNIFANATASSMKSAAGSAKELKKQLQGFDELNNIDFDSGSAGGGGGAVAPDIDFSSLDNMQSVLLDKIRLGDWYGLGMEIGRKINEALDAIPWGKIKDTAKQIALNMTDLFEGMMDGTSWEKVGNTIAQGINTAIEFAFTFVSNFKFTKFGETIGRTLNSFFLGIKWDVAGQTLSKGIIGVLNSITGFLKKVNWKRIGESIKTFLVNIQWKEILSAVKNTIIATFGGINDLLVGIFGKGNTALIESFVAVFASLKVAIGLATAALTLFNGVLALSKTNFSLFGLTTSESIKKISGAGLILTGLVSTITSFASMWKNGMSIAGEATLIFGSAIAGIGLALVGVNPVLAGIIAGATAAIGTIALVTKELLKNKAQIKDTQTALEDYNKAVSDAAEAQDVYENAVDRANDALKRLQEAEKASGLSGEELYNSVQNGTLDYKNMTDQQKEVYKAYKDNIKAQDELKEATNGVSEATKKETQASFENQLSLAKESKSYDSFKQSVVEAYKKGQLSAGEARDYIERAMADMGDEAEETFTKDIPNDIKDGLNPDNYASTGSKLREWVSGIFKGVSIKLPKFEWVTEPASGWIASTLEALGLPAKLPKLRVIQQYAMGGFPDTGELFVAREAGPELVGNIGSKSAVANNDQIIKGISQGVYEAVSNAMAEQQDDNRQIIVNVGNERLYSGYGKYVNTANNKYGTNVVSV